jgi:RNA polymerase sigma-70 factor (ECF subfamily)
MDLLNVNWAHLIERIRDGDVPACEELCAGLTNAARTRLHWGVDSQLVDDELHDVIVTLLEAIRDGRIRAPERLLGFVRTLTRRRVCLHIRSNIRSRNYFVPLGAMDFASPPEQSPEAFIVKRESREAMERILRVLIARDREILMRFYFEEQEMEQICREMKLTSTQFRLYKSRILGRCASLAGGFRRLSQLVPIERRIA